MIADCKESPFGTVHFSADSSHGGNAWSTKQIECKERVSGELCETLKVKYTEYTDNFLFCKESHKSGDGSGRVTEAQRGEYPADRIAYDREDTGAVAVEVGMETECIVIPAERIEQPYDNGGKQNNSTGFFDKGPGSFPDGTHDIGEYRHMVSRELHEKGSSVTGEEFCFFEHDAGEDNSGYAHKIGTRSNPPCTAEKYGCNESDNRQFGTAGDK